MQRRLCVDCCVDHMVYIHHQHTVGVAVAATLRQSVELCVCSMCIEVNQLISNAKTMIVMHLCSIFCTAQ